MTAPVDFVPPTDTGQPPVGPPDVAEIDLENVPEPCDWFNTVLFPAGDPGIGFARDCVLKRGHSGVKHVLADGTQGLANTAWYKTNFRQTREERHNG